MTAAADFLTTRLLWILVRCMRRVLRVSTAFEPTRCIDEQLQLAYERVVPTVRRACGGVEDATQIAASSNRPRRVARKVMR
jgi:hypothetical protein